jgi:uncharacterized protein YbjT (DUF2867 family)
LNYVLFRNALYMDTIPVFVGERVFDTGINLPTGDGRVSFALRSEMGEAIANVLLESDRDNRIYQLTSSDSYTFTHILHQYICAHTFRRYINTKLGSRLIPMPSPEMLVALVYSLFLSVAS